MEHMKNNDPKMKQQSSISTKCESQLQELQSGHDDWHGTFFISTPMI